MRTGVAGAASARSLEVCGDDSGSSSQLLKFWQQEFAVRARRRAFVLSTSIEDVLVAAADRASDRLKRERPAATLNKLAYFIPSLLPTAVSRRTAPSSNSARTEPLLRPAIHLSFVGSMRA